MLQQNTVSLQPYTKKFLFTTDRRIRNIGGTNVCVPSYNKLEKPILSIMLPSSPKYSSDIAQILFILIRGKKKRQHPFVSPPHLPINCQKNKSNEISSAVFLPNELAWHVLFF